MAKISDDYSSYPGLRIIKERLDELQAEYNRTKAEKELCGNLNNYRMLVKKMENLKESIDINKKLLEAGL